jgi:hypothetical protein
MLYIILGVWYKIIEIKDNHVSKPKIEIQYFNKLLYVLHLLHVSYGIFVKCFVEL